MSEKTTDRSCKRCIYRVGNSDSIHICTYFIETGKRRPCPPGKGCTVRETKRKVRRAEDGK